MDEISRIDKSLDSVKPLLDLCKMNEPGIIEITAAAQVLHSFYNGVESIIVLFFKHLMVYSRALYKGKNHEEESYCNRWRHCRA